MNLQYRYNLPNNMNKTYTWHSHPLTTIAAFATYLDSPLVDYQLEADTRMFDQKLTESIPDRRIKLTDIVESIPDLSDIVESIPDRQVDLTDIVEEGSGLCGQRHGVWRTYRGGRLIRTTTYEHGIIHGWETHYDLCSGMKISAIFVNSKKKSRFKTYYPSGRLKSVGCYVEGDHLDGLFVKYDPNGVPLRRLTYQRGKLHGLSIYYHADGQLSAIGSYQNGFRMGDWSIYHYYWDTGVIKQLDLYDGDKLRSIQCYDSTGKFEYSIPNR